MASGITLASLAYQWQSLPRQQLAEALLRFFALRWEKICTVPPDTDMQRHGIDLLAEDDDGTCQNWFVCCSFPSTELDPEKLDECIQRARSVIALDQPVSSIYFIINKDIKDGRIHDAAVASIKAILNERSIHSDVLCLHDLKTFVEKLISDRIISSIRQHSQLELARSRAMFDFGHFFVENVPVAERLIYFQPGVPIQIEEIKATAVQNVVQLVTSSSAQRSTLILAPAGFGKPTTVLQIAVTNAADSHHHIVYVPAAALPPERVGYESSLVQDMLSYLNPFGDFDDQDQRVSYKLAGKKFSSMFRTPKAPYTIVIDALDENRSFDKLTNWQVFVNAISQFECRIILTTRSEHYDRLGRQFDLPLHQISDKYKRRKKFNVYELHQWTAEMVHDYLHNIYVHFDAHCSDEKERIGHLIETVASGQSKEFYGDLTSHPLYLKMIIDEVIHTGVTRRNRAQLMDKWVRRRISVDIVKHAFVIDESGHNVDDLTEKIMHFLELVAARLFDGTNIREYFLASEYNTIYRQVFPEAAAPMVTWISTISGLVPEDVFTERKERRYRFILRVMQEFFLARFISRTGSKIPSEMVVLDKLVREVKDGLKLASLAFCETARREDRLMKIFISYSTKDREVLVRLRKYLKPLERERLVEVWDSSSLKAGERWKEKIIKQIEDANVVILLVSANFLASDFVNEEEIPRALYGESLRNVKVIPVIITACDFSNDRRINIYQAVNSPNRPFDKMSTADKNALMQEVADTVREVTIKAAP